MQIAAMIKFFDLGILYYMHALCFCVLPKAVEVIT